MAEHKGDQKKDPANMDANKAFGRYVVAERNARNWSQRELAKRLDKPPATISAWETGKSAPELHNLVQLATVLDTTVADMLAGAGIIKPVSSVSKVATPKPAMLPSVEPLAVFVMDTLRMDASGHPTGRQMGTVQRAVDNDDPSSYAIAVTGSGLYPRVWPGDCLTIEPNMVVRSGDVAFVVHQRNQNRWVGRVVINDDKHTVTVEATAPFEVATELSLGDVFLHRITSIRPKGSSAQP